MKGTPTQRLSPTVLAWLAAVDVHENGEREQQPVEPFALNERFSTDKIKNLLIDNAGQVQAHAALNLLQTLIKDHKPGTRKALAELTLQHPDAANWLSMYWLQWQRWSDIERIYSPQRLARLAEVLAKTRQSLTSI